MRVCFIDLIPPHSTMYHTVTCNSCLQTPVCTTRLTDGCAWILSSKPIVGSHRWVFNPVVPKLYVKGIIWRAQRGAHGQPDSMLSQLRGGLFGNSLWSKQRLGLILLSRVELSKYTLHGRGQVFSVSNGQGQALLWIRCSRQESLIPNSKYAGLFEIRWNLDREQEAGMLT